MLATVGGENKVRIYDVANDFAQTDTVNVGEVPHGLWASPDGNRLYVGLEFGDEVQAIDLTTKKVIATIPIGQSPQALVYAENAVSQTNSRENLTELNDSSATQVVSLRPVEGTAGGRLAIRTIGLITLVEQTFNQLEPNRAYILGLTKSATAPFTIDFQLNSFDADAQGRYAGQTTGPIEHLDGSAESFRHIVLIDTQSKKATLVD